MVKERHGMRAESHYILTQIIDSLTDVRKFKGQGEATYQQTLKTLGSARLPLATLLTMKLPLKRKLKFLIAATVGINAHCRILAHS